jgi:hypothetical protein
VELWLGWLKITKHMTSYADSVRDVGTTPIVGCTGSTIEIKASLEGINQIRRFKYQASTFSFTVLYQTIENFFRRGNKESYVVQYRDVDNDLITISSDQEFAYAVELLNREKDAVLRLFLTEVNIPVFSDDEDDDDEEDGVYMSGEVNPHSDILPSNVTQEVDLKVQQFRNKLLQKALKNHNKQMLKIQKQQIKKNKKQEKETKGGQLPITPPVVNVLPQNPTPTSVIETRTPKSIIGHKPSRKVMARFVAHITIPDHTILQPNTNFIKTWRFRNDSDASWTPNCRLIFIGKQKGGDDQMCGPDQGVVVNREVRPGDEIDVSVALRAPSKSGRYVGYWRMCEAGASAKKFGQRVWVSILVQ